MTGCGRKEAATSVSSSKLPPRPRASLGWMAAVGGGSGWFATQSLISWFLVRSGKQPSPEGGTIAGDGTIAVEGLPNVPRKLAWLVEVIGATSCSGLAYGVQELTGRTNSDGRWLGCAEKSSAVVLPPSLPNTLLRLSGGSEVKVQECASPVRFR